MLGSNPYYFDLLRKYSSLFGSLFNDLVIERVGPDGHTAQSINVPISYAGKDKTLARLFGDPDIKRPDAVLLPRMSFEYTGMSYDANRKLGSDNKTSIPNPRDKNTARMTYEPVPYRIEFSLYVYAKYIEDGTKIVETIFPFFSPDWTTSVELIPELDVTRNVSIVLKSVAFEDKYEGDFKERQAIVWTLGFELLGWFYGPVKTKKLIKFANVNARVPASDGSNTIAETMSFQPGLTADGHPTNVLADSIPVSDIGASDDFGYVVIVSEKQ